MFSNSFSAKAIIFFISLITSLLFLLNANIPDKSIQLKLLVIANPLSFDFSGINNINVFSLSIELFANAPSLLQVINKWYISLIFSFAILTTAILSGESPDLAKDTSKVFLSFFK